MSKSPYDVINNEITPVVLEKFQGKQRDYPPEGFLFLGSKGQFSDIARKFFKLKKSVWDGEQLDGEQAYEIVEDLIGHCLLLLFCLETEGKA